MAYDTTGKYGILKDLHDAGLRGQFSLFIAGFLRDMKFQVRVGETYFKLAEQETGVPQGSISVCLFCLKINYTDGSRINDRVASAVVYNHTIETTHMPDSRSIFIAEMYPIMT